MFKNTQIKKTSSITAYTQLLSVETCSRVYRVVCTPHGQQHRVTYTRSRIDIIDSPDDEHMAAQNM